jgi:hypothetical protein
MFVAKGIASLAGGAQVDPKMLNQNASDIERRRRKKSTRWTPPTNRTIGDEWQHQPTGTADGFLRGIDAVSKEINTAVETIITIPVRQYVQSLGGEEQRGGGHTDLQTIVSAIPVAVLRPIAGVAEAVSYTVLGIRNDLNPQSRVQDQDIWNHSLSTESYSEEFQSHRLHAAPSYGRGDERLDNQQRNIQSRTIPAVGTTAHNKQNYSKSVSFSS